MEGDADMSKGTIVFLIIAGIIALVVGVGHYLLNLF